MAKRPTKKKPPAKPNKRSKRSTAVRNSPDASEPRLDHLRTRINDIDQRLIRLLNDRAKAAASIGDLKRAKGIPIYAPHRESHVLSRVLALSKGPLPKRSIEGIYREIMSGSFALEKPLRVAYLGPAGSFSHLAAVAQFGSSVEHAPLTAINALFTEVARGHADYALAPIENSILGGITETLDALLEHAGRVHVCAEIQVAVHHALLANCSPTRIKQVHSKPEVFAQCRRWLADNLPHAELVPAPSSSHAVQMVAEASKKTRGRVGPPIAAIGSSLAAELYDVNVVYERIEDNPHNITRFYVVAPNPAERSGDDKTSILFSTLNKPGALADVLTDFKRAGVNLTHIDKRPSQRTNWQYTFFVDAEGHHTDPNVSRAISRAKRHCKDLTVLGSYPRSRRIL